jgi:hypothetical protein
MFRFFPIVSFVIDVSFATNVSIITNVSLVAKVSLVARVYFKRRYPLSQSLLSSMFCLYVLNFINVSFVIYTR